MNGSPARLPAPDLPVEPRSALVIATASYRDRTLDALRAPATDAEDFGAVLADPAIGGFTVTKLVDEPVHEMRIAIEEFLSNRKRNELVLVYVSCHGVTDKRNRLYFAAKDTRQSHLQATGIAARWVNDLLEECRAHRQVLILDCCFSGAFAHGAKGAETPALADVLTEPGRGRITLTASTANEYAFETPTDPAAREHAPVSGSVFTAALVDGLREGSADADGDGFVTVMEAYQYAYNQVRASSASQTPQHWIEGGEGEVPLARNPTGRPVHPVELSESLRNPLESPYPNVRASGVHQLAEWLTSDDLGKVVTARQELERIAENEHPTVAQAARAALREAAQSAQREAAQRARREAAQRAQREAAEKARREAAEKSIRQEELGRREPVAGAPRPSVEGAQQGASRVIWRVLLWSVTALLAFVWIALVVDVFLDEFTLGDLGGPIVIVALMLVVLAALLVRSYGKSWRSLWRKLGG